MTRYRVLVAKEMLDGRKLDLPDGFRFVEVGPLDGRGVSHIVTVEDDGAPESLAGRLVEPAFHRDYETETVTIVERRVIPEGESVEPPEPQEIGS